MTLCACIMNPINKNSRKDSQPKGELLESLQYHTPTDQRPQGETAGESRTDEINFRTRKGKALFAAPLWPRRVLPSSCFATFVPFTLPIRSSCWIDPTNYLVTSRIIVGVAPLRNSGIPFPVSFLPSFPFSARAPLLFTTFANQAHPS